MREKILKENAGFKSARSNVTGYNSNDVSMNQPLNLLEANESLQNINQDGNSQKDMVLEDMNSSQSENYG